VAPDQLLTTEVGSYPQLYEQHMRENKEKLEEGIRIGGDSSVNAVVVSHRAPGHSHGSPPDFQGFLHFAGKLTTGERASS
jgi:hypothetical protein